MYNKLLRLISALEDNAVLASVRKGFVLLIPVLMTGSFALLFRSFPLPAVQAFYETGAGETIARLLSFIIDSTTGFMSAYLTLSVSYYYSSTFKIKNTTLQVMAMILSLACFVASFGAASGSLQLSHFGSTGVFTALLSSLVATKLFFVLCTRVFRSVRSYAVGADLHYKSALSAILPFAVCVALFALLNLLIRAVFHVENLNDLIANGLVFLFRNARGDLGDGLLFTFLLGLLWVFGIHGGNALDQAAQTLFVPRNANPDMIVSKSFLDNFVFIGGSGMTLCLVVALLLFSRTRSNRRLAKSAAPTVLFNINEILVFGLPVVLNPVMIVPFIAAPIVALLLTYSATWLGWVPVVTETVTWTTPVFFSGYSAAGSPAGALLQLVSLLAGTAVYAPFVMLSERMRRDREGQMAAELSAAYRQAERAGEPLQFLNRHDSVGTAAKSLVSRLREDIASDAVPMFYQPQVDESGRVIGAEALLRWKFAGETVFPPLVVALAQEDGLFDTLTSCILRRVCRETRELCVKTGTALSVSVNITAQQLNSPHFVEEVIRTAEEAGAAARLCLEVTEETSLSSFDQIALQIDRLHEAGITVAIDDFSMGSTSLKYLQTHAFQYIKLDGSLVRRMTENPRSREIVASIVALGETLGFTVVAEYVETQDVRDALCALGCRCYQGYLFSPAVAPDAFVAYCLEQNRGDAR